MLINKGQYGEVYRTNSVAIKKMNISRASNWLIELILTRTLVCDRIMTMRDITVDEDVVSIYMDYLDCDLWTWKSRIGNITHKLAKSMIGDISIGLAYLHYCNILHGDMKPSNVLVCLSDQPPTCKITDFGYSSVLEEPKLIRYGTGMYSSPECINEMKARFEPDIWALGLIISYVMTGRMPWRTIRGDRNKPERSWFISAAYKWSIHTNQHWPYIIPDLSHDVEIDHSAIFTGSLYSTMKLCLLVDRFSRPCSIDLVEYLTSHVDVGMSLMPDDTSCRCCECSFPHQYSNDIRLMLEGRFVSLGDKTHEFIDLVLNIDYMPTLTCKRHTPYY